MNRSRLARLVSRGVGVLLLGLAWGVQALEYPVR